MGVKFRVFEQAPKADEEDREVWWRLEESIAAVTLIACDASGEKLPQGNVLLIRPGQPIFLISSVGDIGIPHGEHGRVKVEP